MSGGNLPLTRTSSWFKPELRKKNYPSLGDAYNDAGYEELTKKWNVDTARRQPRQQKDEKRDTYLTLVKQASKSKWIHLRLLADFMQIGRIPRDWENDLIPKDQEKRWARTKICVMEYFPDAVEKRFIPRSKGQGLETEELRRELHKGNSKEASFRLYVVEDLSRNVIEALGTEFGIEPDVFRAHIVDYAWYNVRDRWRDAQPLELVRGRRNWFQMRYVTTRYFENRDQFDQAGAEAKHFNILRRPDDDKSKGWWDSTEAVVALTRSRATFWLKPKSSGNDTAIGVLLLDPTVAQGLPLWRGHRNFHPVPSPEAPQHEWATWETPSSATPEEKRNHWVFEDFIYWAEQPAVFAPHADTPKEHIPVQTLLHLIGSEWLTMCDYIKTRLNQIDLETVDPEHFAAEKHVDVSLGKLHMWRRFIPLYREMVTETLQHVFHFRCHAETVLVQVAANGTTAQGGSAEPATGNIKCQAAPPPAAAAAAAAAPPPSSASSIKAYEEDFKLVLTYLEEYQSRIDRLTSVVTAVMAVEDTRRANTDARNLGRLTWLATFFIPFSVVSGIFSMQSLQSMSLETIRVYFAVTLPVAVVTVACAWALHSPVVRRWCKRLGSTYTQQFKS